MPRTAGDVFCECNVCTKQGSIPGTWVPPTTRDSHLRNAKNVSRGSSRARTRILAAAGTGKQRKMLTNLDIHAGSSSASEPSASSTGTGPKPGYFRALPPDIEMFDNNEYGEPPGVPLRPLDVPINDIVDEDSDHSDLFITPSNVDTPEVPHLISFQPTSLTGAPIPAPQTHDGSAPRPPPVQFSTATSSSVHLYDMSTEASHDAVSQPNERYMSLSDSWIIRVLLLLVCFLNLHHHVGVRACNLLLWVFRKILIELRIIKCFDDFPVTLKTVLNRLRMSLPAKIFVLCERCWQLFPHGENVRHCPHCEIPLYRSSFVDAFQGLIWGKGQKVAKPKVVMPVAPLSALLAGFLSRSDIEAEVEQWGSTHRNMGAYTSIMDGRVWKEMKDKDGKEFFRINKDTGELRLGVTLSLDWFSCRRSVFAPTHSSGVLSFCCANLPPELRCACESDKFV
ncbi:uncharacterized protein EI90DRAFT_3039705 [Cantharellus anzutake]|uniref:uncharacterized protein n=1 Tax=Cantharellus anzutake TaxID=1750568 RepID=UPI0019085D72|nr:uncharacterized protein EI90DRAFT_3075638 [Cantharellus anzutake]XP_038918394.1 uncharacterized protein EI90DRAFT_3049064 [Cantharellus anzutake]XP_038920798.1 uncharacterized protein EI90DRAFT_3039705 [Cantharellus anzutake]KAF8324273.1 hypothetical protein EI90DRAFT_3075638 [Cantharellus anzutake]KAF8334966.1 hypothetical protein EI90DRAFT_3049064 [Cantharellus anzutake]KAF8338925.1 hypothetical protein EI90DRAFT_3039705 [Cantharellus anzutake]